MTNELQSALAANARKNKLAIWFNIAVAAGPFLFGIAWLALSYSKVRVLEVRQQSIINRTQSLSKKKDSLAQEYDRLYSRLLQAKGLVDTTDSGLLSTSKTADHLLQLLKKSVDRDVKVNYYVKTLDQEKVWIAIRDLGYKNVQKTVSTNQFQAGGQTNAVVYGADVPLADIKIIILTLIRAGFKVQHIYPARRNTDDKQLVQIVRANKAGSGEDKSTAISIQQVEQATSINNLLLNEI